MKRKLGVLVLSAAMLVGCVSVGNERVGKLTASPNLEGQTKDVVVALVGEPMTKAFGQDGAEVWSYYYTHAQVKASTFIPIIGGFVGGADSRSKQLAVRFGQDGKVNAVLFNDTTNEIQQGR